MNFKLFQKIVCLTLACIYLFGCATAYDRRGVYHRVRKGESLSRIAKYYHVSVQELAEWNNIQDPTDISEGLKLYIPKAKIAKAKRRRGYRRSRRTKEKEEIQFDRSRFIWPVEGVVFSNFGIRKGRRHDGLDISAKRGTPIVAADRGKVVFDGRLRGYGNMLILKHKNRFFTVYAHNSKNVASKGQKVAKGQLIGYVGSTGRATGPHVHFEVRQGQRARNPIFFLPASGPEKVKVAKRADKKAKGKKIAERKSTKKSSSRLNRRKEMMDKLKAKRQK